MDPITTQSDDTTNQADALTTYRQQYSYYAKRLLADLGLGDLEQEERNQLLASIEAYVQQVLSTTLLENLEDEHMDKIEQLLEDGASQDEVSVYLMTNVPEIDIKIADALANAYAQMLQEANQLAQAVARNYTANDQASTQAQPASSDESSLTSETPTQEQ